MKYTLAAPIKNLDGSPVKGPNGELLTFATVCTACLVQAADSSVEDKVAAFRLAVKIQSGQEEIELTAEDVTRLKRLIGASMPVVIVGRMFELLEQQCDGPSG